MNLHNNWATDTYLFGVDYENNLTISLAIERFEKQKLSTEGFTVTIDGTEERVAIQEHSNPLNADKLDKKLFCGLDSVVKTGSLVIWDYVNYLVSSKPQSNLVYFTSKIYECNTTLRWQSPSGLIYEYPCVANKSALVKLDEIETKGITLLQGQLYLIISNDVITNLIDVDNRFYVGNQVYEIVGINSVNPIGIIELTASLNTKNPDDNDTYKICNYQPISIELIDGNSLLLLKDGTKTLGYNIKMGTEVITNPGFTITWTSSDNTVVSINNGVITGLNVGSANITVSLELMDNIYITDLITITVKNTIVDNYTITISGNYEIPYNGSEIYTATVMNNGNIVTKNVTFSVLNRDSTATDKCSIISSTGTQCTIKNNKSGYAMIKAVMVDDVSIIQTFNIWLKGVI